MQGLIDSFGRKHDYLRISLTDKCNFRCSYCMPSEKMQFLPAGKLMQAEEIISLASIFKDLGIKRVRLTGGEPTLRKDLDKIIAGLSELGFEMSITTNAYLLNACLDVFGKYGLRKINVSLDSLDETKFSQITRRNSLNRVLANIDDAIENGFQLKINSVIVKGENEEEIPALLEWASVKNIVLRYIEFMPFFGNDWDYSKVISEKEILKIIHKKYDLERIISSPHSTSNNYRIPSLNGVFGIIPTVSNPFCNGCNRIRLTADGKVKNCLFSEDEIDLLGALRRGHDVKSLIVRNIERKKWSAAGKVDFSSVKAKLEYAKNRSMIAIGG